MTRKVTWRYWIVLAAGLAADIGLGFWWAGHGSAEQWIYKTGLVAASVLPLVFVITYSVLARWWNNEIGTSLVVAALSLVPITAPFAWALWFNNGEVAAPWLVWTELSGPCLSALAWLWLCWIWLRVHRDGNGNGGS